MSGKVAIVSGGEKGIGLGIARRLSGDGWRVFGLGLDEAAGAAVTAELSGFTFISCDVSEEAQVEAGVQRVLDATGRIDGLVCNAGIASPERVALDRLSLDDWNRVLAVNLTGPLLCAKHACRALRASKGSVVMISSTRARMSEANTFAYSASKGGLSALTHSLAVSLGPDIRVNAVSPGWIHNGDVAELSDADHGQHPAGRVGRAEDIAGLVAYLLGEESGFVTGQDFAVDGGMTKKMIYGE